MEQLNFIIVGHVDHGKSTLIGRLLYDTKSLPEDKLAAIQNNSGDESNKTEFAHLLDHLKEERDRGITIDTTQVFFNANNREYIIIDAPGHVEFTKNMITGASQAEAAIIILDAKEGIKEQTQRHSYILKMLGIEQVIIVINKMDLVKYSEDIYKAIKNSFNRFLEEINIRPHYYIPISALRGENITSISSRMQWYSGPVLLETLESFQSKCTDDDQALLFPIQDVYEKNEEKIIVGRIESGTLKKGQDVLLLKSGMQDKIKSIIKFRETNIKQAAYGESIGLLLNDTGKVSRGEIICSQQSKPDLNESIHAHIFWLSPADLNKNTAYSIRCSTQEIPCKIEKINKRINSSSLKIIEENGGILKNLESGEISIKTESPIAITLFNKVPELGRFVLMDHDEICAGGIITAI